MGFANTLGRDYGTPQSKQLTALEFAWYWFIGGLPILFFLSMLIFPKPNFIVPISLYFLGVICLFGRYIKLEKGSKE